MSELRFETYCIPAADLGPENPLPPLASEKELHSLISGPDIPPEMAHNMAYGHLPNIMPYAIQDGYTRARQPRDLRTAILENEVLKATFLLEFGGRLWSLVHKPSQRELLSVNPVLQPANLALRNAWFSGGVEWNIGTIGHSPLTCAPLFAARLTMPDGTPVLRLYEWERIRNVPFQIDAWLPERSPVLFVRVRIVNPNDYTVPMYWWSNIAVPERPATRVIVPADSAYRFAYEDQGLALIPTPAYQGHDYTYPAQIHNSADFFFHVPAGKLPWIAALDEDGKGLIQVSTPRLKGRKLFVWGMGRGGRRWQEFLAPGGEPYIEIQAGLARTQMEHLPMPAGADWSWLEAYGLVAADPGATHGSDWEKAVRSVGDTLGVLIPKEKLEAEDQRGADLQGQPPTEIVQYGSGWGRLEGLRRKASGDPAFYLPGLVFPDDSLSEDQFPWVALLQDGQLPTPNPDLAASGFVIQKEWHQRLQRSIQSGNANWYAWYQLGILRAYAGDRNGARQAWQESLKFAITPWAMRNLALFAFEEGRIDEAVSLYVDAVRLKPGLIPLVVECGKALLQCQKSKTWLDLAAELPPEVRSMGRVELLVAQAALSSGDFEIVERFFESQVIIPDIREGEVALSDLWFEYQLKRLSSQENCAADDKLRARVQREFPVPAHFDFRMKISPPIQE